MPWYRGPTLLRLLETVPVGEERTSASFRFPVQWVTRPNADFRGYGGMIASGSAAPGTRVICHPSGQTAAIGQILVGGKPVLRARAGQSVLLTLTADLDVARGDVIVAEAGAIKLVREAQAHVFWMDDQPLRKGRSFIARIGTSTATATVAAIDHAIDVDDYREVDAEAVDVNGLAGVTIAFDRPMPLVPYRECRDLGGFILIDRISNDTVALGLIVAEAGGEGKADGAITRTGRRLGRSGRVARPRLRAPAANAGAAAAQPVQSLDLAHDRQRRYFHPVVHIHRQREAFSRDQRHRADDQIAPLLRSRAHLGADQVRPARIERGAAAAPPGSGRALGVSGLTFGGSLCSRARAAALCLLRGGA